MTNRFLVAGLIAVLVASSVSARAAEKAVFAKVGVRAADVMRDAGECKDLAAKTSYDSPAAKYDQRLGPAVVLALVQPGLDRTKRTLETEICMRHRGYAATPLTPAETAALGALQTDEARLAWLDVFLAGEIASRVEAALAPAAPPLPSAQDAHDPFVVGAARIDPGAIVLTAGPVARAGDILRGKLRRRAIAVLQKDFATGGPHSIRTDAGSVFQEYLDPVPGDAVLSEDRTVWCAIFKGGFSFPLCFRNTLRGYEWVIGAGKPWLVGHADPDPLLLGAHYTHPMILTVQSADPQPPTDFHMVVRQIGRDDVQLTATAVNGTEQVDFWSGALKFEADGKARLPFWDRTLVLTRAAGAVTANFEPRADGRGWQDLPGETAKPH